ncbi:30S ribosomal protein S20 [Candidatus Magnetaquicoccaceae bacterium FCR-1]|uniref:Small ribosomal subunit protein bS20 n=1 Tax=Candidatus Magnetaquiglobus chichijimensis TaxID=3141448 RepID=A0ABQ0CCP3_9PROT
MANIKSSMKSIRQTAKQNSRNRSAKSRMRTFVKNVVQAAAAGDLPRAEEALRMATSVLAVTARKKVIHPNSAARHTSRLNARVRALAIQSAAHAG